MHTTAHARAGFSVGAKCRGPGGRKSPLIDFRLIRLLFALCLLGGPAAAAPDPIVVGLDGDLSRDYARAGEAIRRGMTLAVEEINTAGGVLPRLRAASSILGLTWSKDALAAPTAGDRKSTR